LKLETIAIVLIIVLAGLFTGWYLYQRHGAETPVVTVVPQEQAAPVPGETEPSAAPRQPLPPRYPVSLPARVPDGNGAQPAEPPYPDSLEQSDTYLKQRLTRLVADGQLLELLDLDHFIRRLVIIIDALPEASLPLQHLPVHPPASVFRTLGGDDVLSIDPRNAARYTPYVRLAEALPDEVLLRLYQGLYPLFQQAYREMGKPNAHFNDRLVQVIDHLLATPEPDEPLSVVRHINRFKYADPRLESLSAGQKTLLRMGTDNARRIKQKLQRFRYGLIGR